MTSEIKKLTNAESYQWAGIGSNHGGRAATYGVFRDGQLYGVITRVSGGGYMEDALWECRNAEPHTYRCMFAKSEKLAEPGNLVLASGTTLRAVRTKMTAAG